MSFALNSSGGGCYALTFRGEHIGAVFTVDANERRGQWVALIHDGWAAGTPELPNPFTTKEHWFLSLDDLKHWLGLSPAQPTS